MGYGVISTPGVVINGKVVHAGGAQAHWACFGCVPRLIMQAV